MATKIKPPPKGMKVRTRKPATASPVALVPSQGGAPPGAPAQMPIRVAQGALGHICSLANGRLAAQSPRLFRYGGLLVHIERLAERLETRRGAITPQHSVALEMADPIWLQLELDRIAEWQRPIMQVGVLQGWSECDAPMKIAQAVLSDRAGWRVPVLNGVSEIPVIRTDGSIWDTPGYDTATGIYYDPNGWSFPQIPSALTRAHAMTGLLGHTTSFARAKLHLGYRAVRLLSDCALGKKGAALRGHEFHYASLIDAGNDVPLAEIADGEGKALGTAGGRRGNVTGTFFHAIASD